MKKRAIISTICFLFSFIFCISIISPLKTIFSLDSNFLVGYDDVSTANENNLFGSFIKTHLNEKNKAVGGEKSKQAEIVFKLFGFIPIKKLSVVLASDDDYYVGGVPIGLSICADGAIVISDENTNESCFKEGDIITKINGLDVESLSQIQEVLQDAKEEAEVEFMRKNRLHKALVKTQRDDLGRLKLGLWVKDDVTGVGTLTFVNKQTKRYGALGHAIVEANGGNIVPVSDGNVYECNLIGINKGQRNNPGELKCVFSNYKVKGSIEENSKFGISGILKDVKGLVDENLTAKLGGRLGVKMGDAKIVSSISGIREEYDIEIIKTNYQKSAKDKSLVFRVKDKRLLELTGGIVQGMSGSPIMQDGKIIGAVTHVFMSDPTKGYGVYVDWMVL